MRVFDKYILGMMLMLSLAGSGNAQVPQQNRRKQKTEKVADTVRPQTMTHTMPIASLRKPNPPKNSFVKFSNLDESLRLELRTYTFVANDALKLGLMPSLRLEHFCRFKDKIDVGITTMQRVSNYPDVKTLKFFVQDIYIWVKVRTHVGEFYFDAGKESLLNYAEEFRYDMPGNNFQLNMRDFKSGHFYPRVVSIGFKNNETSINVGYAEEDTQGFKFTGNGSVVMATELFIENTKSGLLVTIGKEKTVIDFQMVWAPTTRSALLLEVTNIGNRTGVHGTYRYICRNRNLGFFVNGFGQLGTDGIIGWSAGIRFPKTGISVSCGQIKNDPLRATSPDGTLNENSGKFMLSGEVGLLYPVFQKTGH